MQEVNDVIPTMIKGSKNDVFWNITFGFFEYTSFGSPSGSPRGYCCLNEALDTLTFTVSETNSVHLGITLFAI